MEHVIEQELVKDLLPQKAPFVMVDKLLEYGEAHLTSGFTVPDDNIFVENGKFTEPGIIEHMAQSVALHTGYHYYIRNEPAPTGYLGAIKQVEFHSLPLVGDELLTHVSIIQEFMGITMVSVITTCNGLTVANSQMKTVLAK